MHGKEWHAVPVHVQPLAGSRFWVGTAQTHTTQHVCLVGNGGLVDDSGLHVCWTLRRTSSRWLIQQL